MMVVVDRGGAVVRFVVTWRRKVMTMVVDRDVVGVVVTWRRCGCSDSLSAVGGDVTWRRDVVVGGEASEAGEAPVKVKVSLLASLGDQVLERSLKLR
jgi:hypothetical protein